MSDGFVQGLWRSPVLGMQGEQFAVLAGPFPLLTAPNGLKAFR